MERDPAHLKPTAVFTPTAQEFAQGVSITRNHLILTTLEHVQGRAYGYTRDKKGGWTRKKLAVPDNQTVGIVSTNEADDQFFLILTGFLTPILSGDWAMQPPGLASNWPRRFALRVRRSSKSIVEQLEATSRLDGTKVPYFVVHRKDIKYDGSNPTLLNAYERLPGFHDHELLRRNGQTVKLEHGGVFVLANIRGGGESPAQPGTTLRRAQNPPPANLRRLRRRRQRTWSPARSPRLSIWASWAVQMADCSWVSSSTSTPIWWHAVVIQVPAARHARLRAHRCRSFLDR